MSHADAAALLDQLIREGRVEHGIPAVAYGLLHEGELVATGASFDEGAPEVDATTRFRASSLTKSLTAATTLLLRDRRLLDLETPVAEILPWARVLSETFPGAPVRVRHLLEMASGLPTDDPWIDELDDLDEEGFEDLIAKGVTFSREPGTGYEYCNAGYALAGRVISTVAGRDYREVVSEEILRPLGMTSSGFALPEASVRAQGHRVVGDDLMAVGDTASGAFVPANGLWSCVLDMARWLACLESAAAGVDGQPIPPHVAKELATPRRVTRLDRRRAGGEDIAVAHAYGLGLFSSTYSDVGRVVFHQGGCPGFGAEMRWHPQSRWGAIAMGNRSYAVLAPSVRRTLQGIVGPQIDALTAMEARRAMWPETIEAMDWAMDLLHRWDDDAFDEKASMVLDRQLPRSTRRSLWEELAASRGPFTLDENSLRSAYPGHAHWRMVGANGDIWLEVLMSPESPPRVQLLTSSDIPGATRVL